MKPATKGFRDVVPDQVYEIDMLQALFGISHETAKRWCREKIVRTLPRPRPKSRFRILGSDLLALLGERQVAVPGPSETAAQRADRVRQGRNEINRLAKLA